MLTGEGAHFSAGLDFRKSPISAIRSKAFFIRACGIGRSRRSSSAAFRSSSRCTARWSAAGSSSPRRPISAIAERSTYYGLPEGQRGIFLGGGGSVRIARLIGVARVQDMMLTGRTLSAEEGHQAGVTQYLVEDGKGLEKAMELAGKAAANTLTTNFAVLHALPRIFESDPSSGLLTESLMAAIAELGPEAKQRLKDFLEKRAAKVVRQS